MVFLTACGSVEPAVTDTTETPSGSTSSPATTSTSPTNTATTTPEQTTTLLAGSWADEPVVAIALADGIALGWWDGAQWVQVDESTELPMAGAKDFQIALLGSSGATTTGTPHHRACDISPPAYPGVDFDDQDALFTVVADGKGGERTRFGVAVSAGWDLTPRPVAAGESHPDLEEVAVGLLGDQGLVTETANIVQVVDADLDGNGAIESIVVAEDTQISPEASGVYSIVFAVSPDWDGPEVVEQSVIPGGESGFPVSLRVSAVADLSGDGRMELMIDGLAWEGAGVTVHELTESGFELRLAGGCGV